MQQDQVRVRHDPDQLVEGGRRARHGVEHGEGAGARAVLGGDALGQRARVAAGIGVAELGAVHAPGGLQPGAQRPRPVGVSELDHRQLPPEVHGGQLGGLQGGGHPHRAARQRGAELLAQALQLQRRRQPRPHQLHLVEHELHPGVQQAEAHRPAAPELGETPHEQPRQHHVLRPDEDPLTCRPCLPLAAGGILSAHQQVHRHVEPEVGEPALDDRDGLLDQSALREHEHQPARCRRPHRLIRVRETPVEPGQHRGERLARAGRHGEHVRQSLLRQPGLVPVRAVSAGGLLGKVVKGRMHGVKLLPPRPSSRTAGPPGRVPADELATRQGVGPVVAVDEFAQPDPLSAGRARQACPRGAAW